MRDSTRVGLHIRLTRTLTEIAQKAARLGVKHFQSFFVFQATGTMIKPTNDDIQSFLALRREHFNNVYLHGSYWINLAGIKNQGHHVLQQELALAKKLEFTHIILHPGSAKGVHKREDGIDNLARSLNMVLKKEQDVQIVLENASLIACTISCFLSSGHGIRYSGELTFFGKIVRSSCKLLPDSTSKSKRRIIA